MTTKCIEFAYVDSARLFSNVADQPWSVFLDSGVLSQSDLSEQAAYDVLAYRPVTTLVTEDQTTIIQQRIEQSNGQQEGDALFVLSQQQTSQDDPITLLKTCLSNLNIQTNNTASDYTNGALGYFSYDLARRFETLPTVATDDEQLPMMAMGIYDVIVVVDHHQKTTHLISYGDSHAVTELINTWRGFIEAQIAKQTANQVEPDIQIKLSDNPILESINRTEYKERFQQVRDYIVAGDCYQVNLAKRFSVQVDNNAWDLYQRLRQISPAPYGAYLNLPFATVLSNSPESFIQCHNGNVITSPIKGTRPRDHADSDNDKRIAEALYHSEKDRAENLMIVDLMRNDLSRCCELGSVNVPKLFEIHSFANVHHLISTITGRLKPDHHALDLLRSCFPGGSITGAPKIRAMQIIEQLEVNRRGLYCGAIGYIGLDGNMQTNIAIRTIVIKDQTARFSAGGGLVIDSNVNEEYQEIIDKAKMMTLVFEGVEAY